MRRGGNSPNLAGVKQVASDRDADFTAYEALPEVVRYVIREAPVEMAATTVLEIWEDRTKGPIDLADRLKWMVGGLLEFIRDAASKERQELERELSRAADNFKICRSYAFAA